MNIPGQTSVESAVEVSTWGQERLASGLATIAGYVDAYGVIRYQTYLSFMSGNTTQTGSQLGQRNFAAAIPSAVAIVCFVFGVFGGALLTQLGGARGLRLRYLTIAGLLAIVVVATLLGYWVPAAYIALLSFAMGMMNTVLSHVGAQSVKLTFVTGSLNLVGTHFAHALTNAPVRDAQGPWDTHCHRALVLLSIWACFAGGALLSGFATPHWGVRVLLAPFLILLALAIWGRPRDQAAVAPA